MEMAHNAQHCRKKAREDNLSAEAARYGEKDGFGFRRYFMVGAKMRPGEFSKGEQCLELVYCSRLCVRSHPTMRLTEEPSWTKFVKINTHKALQLGLSAVWIHSR